MRKPKTLKPKLISEFSKNNLEIIRIQITKLNNQPLLDIRVWVLKDGEEYIPTKKGISIRTEQVDSLKVAIDKAVEEIEKSQTGNFAGLTQRT